MLPNDYQPERYQELLNAKVAAVLSDFKALDAPELRRIQRFKVRENRRYLCIK